MMLESLTILLALSALFSFLNERYLKLSMTIGLMLQAFGFALLFACLGYFYPGIWDSAFIKIIQDINFSQFVLQGVLCFLLFAGSKNISLEQLKEYKLDVISLALLATMLSTLITGTFVYFLFQLAGLNLAYIYCLIFGAIISPTDPVAALAILKSVGLPKSLAVIIEGESQFNDGIGVIIFVTLLSLAVGESHLQWSGLALLFFKEVFGGIAVGIIMATISHYLVLNSKTVITQVLISLSAVSIGYEIAEKTGVSGSIASVVLGLVFGNITLAKEHDNNLQLHINLFWDMIEQVLNAILFVLIGLFVLRLSLPDIDVVLGVPIAIIAVLLGRLISVYLSMEALGFKHKYDLKPQFEIVGLFTWVALRGALAVALVLSLPEDSSKALMVSMVYGVVIFSILIQGSTIKTLFSPRLLKEMIKGNKTL